jgi:hypothetical protein
MKRLLLGFASAVAFLAATGDAAAQAWTSYFTNGAAASDVSTSPYYQNGANVTTVPETPYFTNGTAIADTSHARWFQSGANATTFGNAPWLTNGGNLSTVGNMPYFANGADRTNVGNLRWFTNGGDMSTVGNSPYFNGAASPPTAAPAAAPPAGYASWTEFQAAYARAVLNAVQRQRAAGAIILDR